APGALTTPLLSTLTLSGPINGAVAATPLNVTGASNTVISGPIGANIGTLTKTGAGLLVLSSSTNSDYTGGTVITGGTVSVVMDRNLGAANTPVTLDGGALLLNATNFG